MGSRVNKHIKLILNITLLRLIFVSWCDTNFLQLNVDKTKEMVINFRKIKEDPDPVILKGKSVERAHSYKYLGTVLDNTTLSWSQNTSIIISKTNS